MSGAGGLAPMCARCDHQALLPQWDSFSKTEKVLRNFRAGSEAKGICLLRETASILDIFIRVLVKQLCGRLIKKFVIVDLII